MARVPPDRAGWGPAPDPRRGRGSCAAPLRALRRSGTAGRGLRLLNADASGGPRGARDSARTTRSRSRARTPSGRTSARCAPSWPRGRWRADRCPAARSARGSPSRAAADRSSAPGGSAASSRGSRGMTCARPRAPWPVAAMPPRHPPSRIPRHDGGMAAAPRPPASRGRRARPWVASIPARIPEPGPDRPCD